MATRVDEAERPLQWLGEFRNPTRASGARAVWKTPADTDSPLAEIPMLLLIILVLLLFGGRGGYYDIRDGEQAEAAGSLLGR